MKYWILAIGLLVMGCSGGESGSSDDPAAADAVEQVEEAADAMEEGSESVGEAAADALNEAQDAAAEVGDILEEEKKEIDAAIEEATED